jgi:ABC-2 type transport system ATP-binding protein
VNQQHQGLALQVQNLCKSFPGGLFKGSQRILKDVSFFIRQGETCGFVGNNGSGKTTTIKCLFQFVQPDSGEILFFGQKLTSELKHRIGYLPERPYLYDFLSGTEFLQLHWELCFGLEKKGLAQAAEDVLKKVNLWNFKDKKLRTYSKGMLQRIGIAQAILTRPDLIILDEPMSGLDPDGRGLVKDILREEQKRGVTLFFSSHLLADMQELCSSLVVINQGQILFNDHLSLFLKEFQNLEQAFLQARHEV